jgi:hypothetical protein
VDVVYVLKRNIIGTSGMEAKLHVFLTTVVLWMVLVVSFMLCPLHPKESVLCSFDKRSCWPQTFHCFRRVRKIAKSDY